MKDETTLQSEHVDSEQGGGILDHIDLSHNIGGK